MDANLKISAIDKLLDLTASGVGAVAGPMLAPWKARREAQAKQIAAQGEANALEILARGQSNALQIITAAQAEAQARAQLVSPDVAIQGELDIAETVSQRIQFQEKKRQRNIATVVRQAAEELGDKDVPNSETDHDWTARFFNDVQDVSSEEMQILWAKVLAGEVERSGSTSIRTLGILRNLDQTTAQIFTKLCSMCISVGLLDGNQSIFTDSRAPSLGAYSSGNALKKYGVDFGMLNLLNEHGLVIPGYNSWRDYSACIGLSFPGLKEVLRFPFKYQGRYWFLLPTTERTMAEELRINGVALTKSGQELLRVVGIDPMSEYTQDLMNFFEGEKLQMVESKNGDPELVKTGAQM